METSDAITEQTVESSPLQDGSDFNHDDETASQSNAHHPPMQGHEESNTSFNRLHLGDSEPAGSAFHPPPLPNMGTHSIVQQAEQGRSLDILDCFQSVYYTGLPVQSFLEPGTGTWTPRSVMDFGLRTDLELNDMDLQFLDTYNIHVPFDNRTPSDKPSCGSVVGIGAAVFRESVWRFIPVPRQSAPRPDKQDFEAANGDAESPAASITIPKRTTSDSLPQPSRDRLLAIFLSNCKPATMTRLALSFPSVDLLDNLLQFYLTSPLSNGSTWLHIPTLAPSKIEAPELLAGMIAAGAVLAPDPALIKLGFAFQEALRTYLPLVFEEDNSLIRELQVLQAFMLQIEIGLWSGNSRRIEIAESFQQPLLTVSRARFPSFRVEGTDQSISPFPDDSPGGKVSKFVVSDHRSSARR
jgi:hypothetical protein